jgi:hypothetical protein
MADKPKAGWFRYIKEAFLYRWNLLVFGGAAVAAIISPSPDVVLPIVAAGELAYLAGLTTLPRFQAAIDARARKESGGGIVGGAASKPENEADQKARLLEVLNSVEPERRNRFLRLRARCVEMQRIANAVRGETRDTSGASAELRAPSLDRLLWMFLRLLLAQQAIERFLKATDGEVLKKNMTNLQDREKALAGKGDERMERSIKDAMNTAQVRLDNYAKAQNNFEFVALELDRIEQKIQALSEMAVSHENPDELSVQVDAVADGMQQTEETIRQLQAITGLGKEDEAAPSILGGDMTEAIKQ